MNKIDVAVPCCNYGCYLRECVDSVLDQDDVSVRVLIIDDASRDHSMEVAEECARMDQRVSVVGHTENRGHIATFNEAIEWASAEFMLILSADDYLLPGALRRATDLLHANREVGMTFGNASALFADGHKIPLNVPIKWRPSQRCCTLSGREFLELSGARNIVPTATAVVRTSLQKNLGSYRGDMPHSADMEMWWRFASVSSVGLIRERQAIYRRHSRNMSLLYSSRKSLPDLKQRELAIDAVFNGEGRRMRGWAEMHRRARRRLGQNAVSLASEAFNEGDYETMKLLQDFALRTYSDIKWTSTWQKLVLKRIIGRSAWNTLRLARENGIG